MKLKDLHNWLESKNFYSSKRTNEYYISESFRRYVSLLTNLELKIRDVDTLYKHYILFISMYSIKSLPIKEHTPFIHEKDIKALDIFGTFYGESLIQFIVDEQYYFNQYSIDILQKKNKSILLEFIIFTIKHIELDELNMLY